MKLAILASALLCASAQAVTIHWGNSLFDSLKQSDGVTPINDVDFTVQLGFFDGLTPDISNVDQWQASWRVFDQANFNSAIGYFTGSANLDETTRTSDSPFAPVTDPLTTFPSTAQAHIWISNGGAANQPGTEWAVFTNPDWTFPESGQHDQVEWRVSDPGTTAVFGTVVTPFSGPSTIEAATFPVIPEPGSTILLLLSLSLAFRRRTLRTTSSFAQRHREAGYSFDFGRPRETSSRTVGQSYCSKGGGSHEEVYFQNLTRLYKPFGIILTKGS